MWKRLRIALERLLIGLRPSIEPRQGRDQRRTREARSRFWSDVSEGRREAEAASAAAPLAPAVEP